MKLWQKKYDLDADIEAFTVGEDYLLDQRLVPYDCRASKAHAKALEKAGILIGEECRSLCSALDEIVQKHAEGAFTVKPSDEDCHTAIEAYLTEKLGDAGKKIHTGRSRNDQVQAALRLYYKDALEEVRVAAGALEKSLSAFAEKNDVAFPGYTHTRKAMPASTRMWAGAFLESLADDLLLLDAARALVDQNPLGTGAGYGVPLDLDRALTQHELGFARVQTNPLYVQNSRGKFEAALVHALSQFTADLNRMATDLIFFGLPELGYFKLPDRMCTGSSIMPQKKNPDVFELVRASHHTVLAAQSALQSMSANLLSGYNRDLQLSKKPVMDSFGTAVRTLRIMARVFEELEVDREKCKAGMTPEVFATHEAYELIQKGVPFREAYRRVAEKFSK